MSTTKPPTILFDIGHNEELTLDAPELSQLVALLQENGFVAVQEKITDSLGTLSKFQVVVLGNPLDSSFTPQEISALVSFVEMGGGLLLVSGATIFGKGGDAARNTNLNAVAKHFGFEFSTKALEPPADAPDELIIAMPAAEHLVLARIDQVLFASGVSIIAEDPETHLFRVTNIPGNHTIAIATESMKGKITAFGGGTPFFNEYIGFGSNENLIVQIFRWLSGEPTDIPVKKLSAPPVIMDEITAAEAIADLRKQLDKIEEELSGLKEVIDSSVKEMEKIVKQVQEEGKKKP